MAFAVYSITELYGEAREKALKHTADLWNSCHTHMDPNTQWFELEQWAEDIDLMFDVDGELLD